MYEAFDEFISAVAAETHVKFEKEEDGTYIACLDFEGGRHQRVLVYVAEDEVGDPIIEYYSQVCKTQARDLELFRTALRLNVELKYGALALMDDNLIVHQTTFLTDMDPQRFFKSLSYVAAKADELEEQLVQVDRS